MRYTILVTFARLAGRRLAVLLVSAAASSACAHAAALRSEAPGEPIALGAPPSEPAPGAASPAAPPIDWSARLGRIDDLANETIAEGKIPGCVVFVGRHDGVVFRRAYGARALVPEREAMTDDTIFDLASLTKPIATATSILILVERGLVALDEPAATYVPELAQHGKGAMTIRDLLLHVSGLPTETPVASFEHGRAHAMDVVYAQPTRTAPGEKFQYSDLGYLVLEEVVRRVTGEELDAFARANVFEPLAMRDTSFRRIASDASDASLLPRVAPTEWREGAIIRGVVHDPRAWKLGGVAGNAGVFSTADDLARYARAILNGGALDGARILQDRTVRAMLAPHDVPGGERALGWDVRSAYSSNGGDCALAARHRPRRVHRHGAVDPSREGSLRHRPLNRVHPYGQGAVNPLVGRVANVAGEAIAPEESQRASCAAQGDDVLAGIDVLRARDFDLLDGSRVGLITNASGRAKDGASTALLLQHAPGVELVALFAPEHGLSATQEGKLGDAHDPETGLPVHSLFGATFAPTSEALDGVDTLVFDVQDAACASTRTRRRCTARCAPRPTPASGSSCSIDRTRSTACRSKGRCSCARRAPRATRSRASETTTRCRSATA